MNAIRIAAAVTLACIAAGAVLIVAGAPHDCTRDPDDDAMRDAVLTEFDWHAAQLAALVNESERRLDPWGIGRVQLARNGRH